MSTGTTPAFYSVEATAGWKDYLNLLHFPYTLWHLSYVVIGAALAQNLHPDRLIVTLVAFFLAVGIGAHAFDELNGRPLGTKIPSLVLGCMAVICLGAAVALGVVAGLVVTAWIFPFVAFGAFITVAYNLGLWHNRFHSDFWFALSWGAFPALTSYWINSTSLTSVAVLLALACFTLSYAQRVLSTQVRCIRRKTISVQGTMVMVDDSTMDLDRFTLLLVPERALRTLSVAIILFAASALAFRL